MGAAGRASPGVTTDRPTDRAARHRALFGELFGASIKLIGSSPARIRWVTDRVGNADSLGRASTDRACILVSTM